MTMFIVIGWRQVATNSWYKLQTDSSPSVACHMPDIHPLPIHPVLLLSHKDDAHFTIPQRMAGWLDLSIQQLYADYAQSSVS